MGVQERSLEFYRQLGLSEALVGLGIPTGDAHVWVNGQERVNFSLKTMGEGLIPIGDENARYQNPRLLPSPWSRGTIGGSS